jgi:hypothetical protein
LVGLEIVADAKVVYGNMESDIKKGQIAYFQEEMLFGQEWSRMTMTCDGIEGDFIIADATGIVLVK